MMGDGSTLGNEFVMSCLVTNFQRNGQAHAHKEILYYLLLLNKHIIVCWCLMLMATKVSWLQLVHMEYAILPIQTSPTLFFGTYLKTTICWRIDFMTNQKAYQQDKGEDSI